MNHSNRSHHPPIVDVIIPARNEAANIPALLKALPRQHLRHIIVVDNGSQDATGQLAALGGAVVVDQPQRGYGAACRAGLQWISHQAVAPDIVGFVDADLADDPQLLVALCQPISAGQADMVIAARNRLAEPGALTVTQRLGNRLACSLIWWLTGKRYRDLGPMRVVAYDSLQAMQMADCTWGWTVEMQFKAAMMNLKTLDINVPYRRRHAGTSKISGSWLTSAVAGWKIITTILALWYKAKFR